VSLVGIHFQVLVVNDYSSIELESCWLESVVSANATMLVGIIELDFIKFKMD